MKGKPHTDQELTKALLLILENGLTVKKASEITGINPRSIQRYKARFVDTQKSKEESVASGVVAMVDPSIQESVDRVMLTRVKFLEDVFNVKQKLLKQLDKVGSKSTNVDALQRSIKTLNDIEKEVTPEGDAPMVHAKTVNVFQLFNQNLIKNGYKGPELTDADIVKGD